MKTNSLITAGLISAVLLQAAGAAVNITGTMLYQQNFDTLPTGPGRAEFDWTDDVTLPGFYLHRSNTPAGQTSLAGALTTPGARPYIADASVLATVAPNHHGFLSLGFFDNTERALGNCPTTGDGATNWCGGTLSIVAIFTNTGTKSVDLGDMTYEVENWLANTAPTTAETISLTYKLGTAAALVAELGNNATGANFIVPGYNPVAGGIFDLTSFDGFSSPPVPGSTERSGAISPPIRIAPGQSLALRWGNPNDGGTDAMVAIDNLIMSFQEVDASVAPVVSNVVRNNNATPADPGDDTVSFDLTVAGLGSVNPLGWTISSAPLTGATGTYGVLKAITGVPIVSFGGPGHTLDVVVEDQGNPTVNATVTVTAPWCTLTPVVTNVIRDSLGNADPADDTWGYTVTVNAQFGGAGFNSDNAAVGPTGTYGVAYTVSGLPIFIPSETTNFSDLLDPTCTAAITVSPPRILGTKNFGTTLPLFSDGAGVPANWVVDEFLLTQTMNNGGGAPAKVYSSEVLNLTAVGEVQFSASLAVNDLTSGFEVDDTFDARLIINGDTANPVSLITAYDTLPPPNGMMNGAEISPATIGPPPVSGPGSFLHTFLAVIPASANSVQLVVSGVNNSTNETMAMQNIVFELAAHAIQAQLAPAVQFDNKGTVDPADDEFRQGVNITAISPPAGSTGWTSNLTPAAGLYADANPVLFGPFSPAAGPQTLILTDNNVPAVTTSIGIPAPTPDLVTTPVAGTVVRNDQGTPDPADDTLTADFMVSAPVGGPSFLLEKYPGSATAPSSAMSATPQLVTVTLTAIPEHGVVHLAFRDASYPLSEDRYVVTVPPAAVTNYVVAKKNLGGGLSNVVTQPKSPLPVEWSNYPSVPALQMNNGAGAPEKVVTSEVIDLTGVNGPVNFTANLRATDFTSGFEAADTFKAELILDGDTANPVNLTAVYDLDASGSMNGAELVPPPVVNPTVQVFNYPLSAVIPDTANSVQLIVTGVNDSANEMILFENALFVVNAVPPIVPGNGAMALNVGASGKQSTAGLAALATGGGGPVSVSGVQAGPTPRGGTVTIQGGWIIYEPAPGVSGVDTFTYSLTDGTQTVAGTFTVVISVAGGPSFNVAGIVPEGAGNRIAGMGIPGRFYQWQYSADMTAWTPLGPPSVCPASGAMSILDPGPLPPSRFYRLVEVGAPK